MGDCPLRQSTLSSYLNTESNMDTQYVKRVNKVFTKIPGEVMSNRSLPLTRSEDKPIGIYISKEELLKVIDTDCTHVHIHANSEIEMGNSYYEVITCNIIPVDEEDIAMSKAKEKEMLKIMMERNAAKARAVALDIEMYRLINEP